MTGISAYLQTFNSPFKRLKFKWYFGKTLIGVPYFLPRRWVKYTMGDAVVSAKKSMANESLTQKSFKEWVKYYENYSKPVPIKFGFSSCELGWKTKWRNDDYRFEYPPIYSFVVFGYQIVLTLVAPYSSNYWESFLAYKFNTDTKHSKKNRIKECVKNYPQNWVCNGEKINYWELILKQQFKLNK